MPTDEKQFSSLEDIIDFINRLKQEEEELSKRLEQYKQNITLNDRFLQSEDVKDGDKKSYEDNILTYRTLLESVEREHDSRNIYRKALEKVIDGDLEFSSKHEEKLEKLFETLGTPDKFSNLDELENTKPAIEMGNTNTDNSINSQPPQLALNNKMKKAIPTIAGLLLGATPALAVKLLCTTALTPIVPFPIAAFVFGFSYNLGKNIYDHKKAGASLAQSLKAVFTGKSLAKSLGAGAIGAGASLLGGFLVEEFVEGISCEAPPELDTPPPVAEPLYEQAPPVPEVVPIPDFTILTVDDIIDPARLLDLEQNDTAFVQTLLDAGQTYGVDPSVMEPLQAQIENGFDFIDSANSAESVAEFNSLLETAMEASSQGGESVTSEEYSSILSGFMEKLSEAEFKIDTVGVIDDTYLDTSLRDTILNQAQTLRATI